METKEVIRSLRAKAGLSQEDLVEFCVEHFAGENCPPEQMRAYMQQKLPKLKYWSSGAADKKI